MKWARYALVAAIMVATGGEGHAIVTSNTGRKASFDQEVAQGISVQTSKAIEGIWRAIAAIEGEHELNAGAESIEAAISSLNEVMSLLEKAVSVAETKPVEIGDVAQVQVNAEYMEAVQPVSAEEVLGFLQRRIQPWPPTERAMLEFLMEETKTAVAAAEIMHAGQADGNEDMVRLGLMTFQRFQYSAIAFSVLWGLVST